jgi:hypothetical protein
MTRLSACALVVAVACGGAQRPSPPPKIDTAALAAELDTEMSEVAQIIHTHREQCPQLASELLRVFKRMRASIDRAHEAQQDPELAKALTAQMRTYDGLAAQRTAQIDADLTPDSPCVRDPHVREVLMSMPTL